MSTVSVPEPYQDLDAVLAMMIAEEDARDPFRWAADIAVQAIVALSHAGAAVAEYRRLFPAADVDYHTDPRADARRMLAKLITMRREGTQ